jgi:hypothetical protein
VKRSVADDPSAVKESNGNRACCCHFGADWSKTDRRFAMVASNVMLLFIGLFDREQMPW